MKRHLRAFTLMELLTVIAIIGILIGLMVPIGRLIVNKREVNRTTALVQAVAAAIASYPSSRWELTGTVRRTYPWLWDMNVPGSGGRTVGDGIIDGFPATTASATADGPFEAALLSSGYLGFARMAMPDLLDGALLNAKGQPIDAWGSPLHIAYAGSDAGPTGCRVWSLGKDRTDQAGSGDDITSTGRR